MADNRGGYQQPNNPAPVSLPGALSQRTDGGAIDGMTQPVKEYTGMGYGENKAVNDQQTAAPLAGSLDPFKNLVPLNAPTQRPEEPITNGIDRGPGAGSEAMMGTPNYAPTLIDTIKHLAQFDASGDSELIYRQLSDNGF